jgi:hypothetical protein
MRRRAFLAAVTGGTATLAGCSAQRETVRRREGEDITIAQGGFYHEQLDLGNTDTEQFNLRYEVTGEGPFDVYLFGGQADPDEYAVYRRAVSGDRDANPTASDWHTVTAARETATVNRPLGAGIHHFVVDNTAVGPAEASGPLQVSFDLAVRNFDLLPDWLGT